MIAASTTGLSVLLVEGSEAGRKALRLALEREPGVSIIGEAASHAAAMKLFFEQRPDAVLVGVCLPDSSGFDVLVCMRQADARCSLFLVGEDQDSFVTYVGRVYGATEVCHKDHDFHHVRAALRRVVHGRKTKRENVTCGKD